MTELEEFLETNEHVWQCASWSEGQLCCLDKPEIMEKVREFILNEERNEG